MSRYKIHPNQLGDTLVEVMLAAAVLSLVMAGAFTISNKATRVNQSANERTNVSNLMQREVEFIRASHQQDPAAFWKDLDYATSENANFCDFTTGSKAHGNAFYTDASLKRKEIKDDAAGKMQDAIPADFFDIWVEAVEGSDTHADFFVYGCWEGIGGEGTQSSGLVMRISK